MTAAVAKVYRWEIAKLLAQKRTYLGLVSAMAVPLIFVVVLVLQSGGPNDVPLGRYIRDTGLATPFVVLFFMSIWGFPLITALVAGDIVASESQNGTLKTILTRSRNRGEIFAAKVLASITYTLVIVFAMGLVGAVAGSIAWGLHPLTSLSGTKVSAGHGAALLVASLAVYVLPLAGIAAFAVFLSTVTRNSAAAVVGALMWALLMQLLGVLPGTEAIRPYLLGTQFELLDVGGRLLVGGDCLADLLAVTLRCLVELGDVDLRPEDFAEALAQRERGARAGGERDVVRDRRPQAHGWNARVVARVVEHADDSGRSLIARALQAEPFDQLRIGGTARHGRGPRVRHIREQRAERDHQLDAEVAREIDDHAGDRAPAKVRLDPEQQHRVSLQSGDRRMVEGVLRPFDVPRLPVDERDVRPGCLEVVEVLRLDLREAFRLPRLGEVAAGEGCALPAVVPPAERGDQNRRAQARTVDDAEFLSDRGSLRSVER